MAEGDRTLGRDLEVGRAWRALAPQRLHRNEGPGGCPCRGVGPGSACSCAPWSKWRTANWYRGAFGSRNPWGPRPVAQVMGAESEVERQLSTTIMRGGPKPRLHSLRKQ